MDAINLELRRYMCNCVVALSVKATFSDMVESLRFHSNATSCSFCLIDLKRDKKSEADVRMTVYNCIPIH